MLTPVHPTASNEPALAPAGPGAGSAQARSEPGFAQALQQQTAQAGNGGAEPAVPGPQEPRGAAPQEPAAAPPEPAQAAATRSGARAAQHERQARDPAPASTKALPHATTRIRAAAAADAGGAAAEAGLQKNDIVISIDEKPVGTKEELIDAVTASEGKELHLEILRAGDKQKIAVTPKKMKVPVVFATVTDEDTEGIQDIEGMEKLPEHILKMIKERAPGVRIQRIHPGVIVEGKAPTEPAEMHKMIENLRKAAEAKARDAHAAAVDAQKAHAKFSEERVVHESMKQLHEEMKAMQEELQALRKQLKETEKE